MFKRFKNITLFLSIAILLLFFSSNAFALETQAPPVVNGIDLSQPGNQNLPTLVAYLFYLCIAVVGIVGVAIIAFAGFQYVISAGNPSMMGDAKDRVKSALLGIALLFLSFIIINTINPDLLNLRSNEVGNTLPPVPLQGATIPPGGGSGSIPKAKTNLVGISYANAQESDEYDCKNFDEFDECFVDPNNPGYEFTIADKENADVSDDGISNPSTAIFYNHSPNTITVQVYYLKDFGENSSTQTIELAPEGTIPLTGVLSFKWKVREPGIYFYSNPNCTGDSSYDGIIKSQDMPRDFMDAKSVKIINDPKQGLYYGFISNGASSFAGGVGACGLPALNTQDFSICLSVTNNFHPQYLNVFTWNEKYGDRKNYQNGVSLYGMPVLSSGPTNGTVPNRQDYTYIPSDKVVNQYYYEPNGPNGSGYYQQRYYNISSNEIITQADIRGYYICPADPGFLLRDGASACAGGPPPGGNDPNSCSVGDPVGTGETSCPLSDGGYCIQAVETRDKYWMVFYAENENGDNSTCAIFSDNIYNFSDLAAIQNGRKPFTLVIIPVK